MHLLGEMNEAVFITDFLFKADSTEMSLIPNMRYSLKMVTNTCWTSKKIYQYNVNNNIK